MPKDLFYSMDLNLLRTFLVVAQELNTRKAAERLFVSQPAVSQALQKLRERFNDELFVKVPSGLQATPYAQQLAEAISPHLNNLASVLNESEQFDPFKFNSSLRIAVAPSVLTCLSGALFRHFLAVAPNCTLELVAWKNDSLSSIQKDDVTLGISLAHPLIQSVDSEVLLSLQGKLIVRADHPLQGDKISAQDLAPYPIASIVTPGWNDNFTYAAILMEQEGVKASVGFRSEFVTAVVDVIEQSDFFMPDSNLFPIHRYPKLKAVTPVKSGQPYQYPLYAYFHKKNHNTQMMDWLIKQIKLVIEQETNNC